MSSSLTSIFGAFATAGAIKDETDNEDYLTSEKGSSETKEINNNTLLKQTISLAGAGISVLSNLAFGVKIPVYEGTLGDRLINEREALSTSSREEVEEAPKISTFHNVTRNIANALIITANIPLFIATRSALPILESTPPSFVTSLKTYAKSNALNVYEWHDQHKDQPTITGSIARTAGALARSVNYAHESWGNFIKSKAVYHTLNVGVGVATLGFMGPPGWAIAGAVVSADIIRGSARVNRIQVRQDELNHLTSLKQSQKQIESLEQGHSQDFLKGLGKPNLLLSAPTASAGKTKDELNQAAYKAVLPTLLKEGISVGVAAANAAVNHAGFAVASTLAFLALGTNTKAQLSEEESKDSIKSQTANLYNKIGIQRNPEQSRQYDLAKTAYEHAVYAEALKLATKDRETAGGIKADASDYKKQAEANLKKDPEFQTLFHPDKMEKPSTLGYVYRAAKSSVLSVADYLHPLKEATSYAQVHEAYSEKQEKLHAAQHAAAPTPTLTDSQSKTAPSKQAELMAKKERKSLTTRSSSSEGYSETTPLMNRSRSQSRDSSRGL